MQTYNAWGFDDVGVFLDWACMYQALPDASVTRTAEQELSFRQAQRESKIWWSHKMTSVYIINYQQITPTYAERGWPFFVESLCALFKDTPPTKPFKVRYDQLVPLWSKIVELSAEEVLDDPAGVNPLAGTPKKRPPLSAPHFLEQVWPVVSNYMPFPYKYKRLHHNTITPCPLHVFRAAQAQVLQRREGLHVDR